mgnify:CR=1 FL=1
MWKKPIPDGNGTNIRGFRQAAAKERRIIHEGKKTEETVKTNVMRLLEAAGIHFETGTYEVDENDLSGSHAADLMGVDHDQMYKTLVLKGEKKGYLVCCLPVDENWI